MRKAQTAQQVFIYILAVLIIGLIFLFGYDAVLKLYSQAEIISSTELKNKIIEKTAEGTSYGAVTKMELNLGDFDKICMVDLNDEPNPGLCSPGQDHYNRQACNAWRSKLESKANVFLISSTKFETVYAGNEDELKPNVKIDALGYICLEGDKVTFKLKGQGDSVLVSEWQ